MTFNDVTSKLRDERTIFFVTHSGSSMQLHNKTASCYCLKYDTEQTRVSLETYRVEIQRGNLLLLYPKPPGQVKNPRTSQFLILNASTGDTKGAWPQPHHFGYNLSAIIQFRHHPGWNHTISTPTWVQSYRWAPTWVSPYLWPELNSEK